MTGSIPGAQAHNSVHVDTPRKPGLSQTTRARWAFAPVSIKTTTVLWSVAAVFTVVSALILIGTQLAQAFAIQGALNQAETLYPGDYVQGMLIQSSQPNPVLLAFLCMVILVLGLLATAGYVVVGANVLAGRNAARIVGTCLAACSLILIPLGVTGIIVILLSIGGAVASWMPTATAYIGRATNNHVGQTPGGASWR